MWVFLGEALEKLANPVLAWRAYERAWVLDPQAEWVDSVRRRLSPIELDTPNPDWFEEVYRVKKVTVTAAMIVKNESRTLDRALAALKPAVDEIVLVDTGSTDDTVAIAQRHGVPVHSFVWNDDFSAARNFALEQVTKDWVLWIDGDECLDPDDVAIPRLVAGMFDDVDGPVIARVGQINKIGDTIEPNFDMSRFFPTRYGLRWWGKIHEQVGPGDGGMFGSNIPRPAVRIRLNHDGYDPAIMRSKGKLERNIKLLREEVAADPKDVAAYGFLGRELYLSGQWEEAVKVLYKAEELALGQPRYGRLAEVRSYLMEALMKLNRLQEALVVAERVTSGAPNYPNGWYLKGVIEMTYALRLLESSRIAYEKAKNSAKGYRGIVSYDTKIPSFKAVVGLADINKLLGNWEEALRLYRQALKEDPQNRGVDNQITHLVSQSKKILE